jgi:hypothetical protein
VRPSPLVQGRGHSRLRERGWAVPIPTRGHTLWYSSYICTLWVRGFINRKIQGPSPFSIQRICTPNLRIISRVHLCYHRTKLRNHNFVKTLVPFQTFLSKSSKIKFQITFLFRVFYLCGLFFSQLATLRIFFGEITEYKIILQNRELPSQIRLLNIVFKINHKLRSQITHGGLGQYSSAPMLNISLVKTMMALAPEWHHTFPPPHSSILPLCFSLFSLYSS